jgi:DNA-directed RNA polymerase specialized sigma24 family protein
MRDARRRLARLEYENLRHMAVKEGERYGFTADDVLAECRRVFALPDDQQREVLHRLYKDLSEAEAAELDAIRHRDARILRGQR